LHASELLKSLSVEDIKVLGTMNAKGGLSFPQTDWVSGKGELSATVKDMIFSSEKGLPMLPIAGKLSLGNLKARLSMDKGVLRVGDFSLTGGDITGNVTGSVRLSEDILSSTLDLVVDLKSKSFEIPRGMKIGGTLASPILQ
jgi:type II secretion system protein N